MVGGRRQTLTGGLRPGVHRQSAATAALLRHTRLFTDLPSRQLKAFVRYSRSHEVEAGTTLLVEGEPGAFLGVIISGTCVVEQGGVQVAELTTGGCFGEMSLIDGLPCAATVIAKEPTELLVLGRSDFDHVLKVAPGLGRALLEQLCLRLREVAATPVD